MGGHALSTPSVRLDAQAYHHLAKDLTIRLAPCASRLAVIASYGAKDSFGDMDILVAADPGYDPLVLARFVQAGNGCDEIVRNGPVTSLGLHLTQGQFQIDLIAIAPECFDFAYRYFCFNDLGNLLGRVAHKAGFSLGHKGLEAVLRRGDHVLGRHLLTRDWRHALNFLSYDGKEYERRATQNGFQTLEDIFRFAASSPYFHPDIYALDQVNARARVRDRKRPTYTKFLDWIQGPVRTTLPHFDWTNKVERRAQLQEKAMAWFPGYGDFLRDAEAHAALREQAHQRFNGRIVGDLTGLSGPRLGQLIARIKAGFDSDQAFEAWAAQAPDEDIREIVDGAHRALQDNAASTGQKVAP